MKKLIYLIILSCCFSLSISAQRNIITVFEGIKIKNEKRAETLFYYENNWKIFRQKAIKKGYIHSFELLEATADKEADFDIVLITRYKNQTQYDKAEERFQKLIRERGGLKLLNDLKPGDFRENVFVKIGKSDMQTSKK